MHDLAITGGVVHDGLGSPAGERMSRSTRIRARWSWSTGMHEDDVVAIMADPLIGVGSNNGAPVGMQHPRTWGCFPDFFGRFVRERRVVGWEKAIRKATSATALQFDLAHRGTLQPGSIADICVFDPERSRIRAPTRSLQPYRSGSNTWRWEGRSWSIKARSPVPAPAPCSGPRRDRGTI
jgi:N-acyl-D-aspartate/D-glutamate deacylase